MRTRSNCPNPSCINNIYENPGGYKCGWCKKLEEPNFKAVESESAQVGRILVKLINKNKANRSPMLSKMIKALKDNPTIKSLAYIQAKEFINV